MVPEYQCAVKREAKKAQKEKERPGSSALGSPGNESSSMQMTMKEASPEAVSMKVPTPQSQYQQEEKAVSMVVCSPGSAPGSIGSGRHHHQSGVINNNGSLAGSIIAVKPLSPEQEELINRLVYFQEEFDQPSEEDLRKISVRL